MRATDNDTGQAATHPGLAGKTSGMAAMAESTVSAQTVADAKAANPGRAVGVALIACAVASVLLLANHPGAAPGTFIEVLRAEAANQGADAAVHGGFVVVLSVEFICFAAICAKLGFARLPVLCGLVFTAAGFAALSASMIVDGLVTPSVAARYAVAAPNKMDDAKALLLLCGTFVRFLMQMGLAFQAAGTASWGAALVTRSGRSTVTGAVGLVVGAASMAALAITYASLNASVLMGALAAQALWTVALGVLAFRRRL